MGFTEFPAQWEWVALIIGGVAFMMAVQPFTQFIWGRPKIEVEFSTRDNNSSRSLDILLLNYPVKNRVFRFLGVHRMPAEDVWVSYRIKDARSGNQITKNLFPEISTARGENKKQISLTSSYVPASFLIASATSNGETMLIANGNGEGAININSGKYEIELEIHYGERNLERSRRFWVGTKPYELFWEDETKS